MLVHDKLVPVGTTISAGASGHCGRGGCQRGCAGAAAVIPGATQEPGESPGLPVSTSSAVDVVKQIEQVRKHHTKVF